MRIRKLMVSGFLAALVMSPFAVNTAFAADDHIYMAGLSYRTGPYAPNGIPFGNGFADYLTLLNERDGGVGGVPIVYEECETQYNTKMAVECYEKLKGKRPQVIIPNSTGVTYQLIPKLRWPPEVCQVTVRHTGQGGAAFLKPITYLLQRATVQTPVQLAGELLVGTGKEEEDDNSFGRDTDSNNAANQQRIHDKSTAQEKII